MTGNYSNWLLPDALRFVLAHSDKPPLANPSSSIELRRAVSRWENEGGAIYEPEAEAGPVRVTNAT